jgi:hypothetical protein
MATRVQRIAITPSVELRALLLELSEVSGQSLSSVASEMLEDVAPVMRSQLEAMKLVAATPHLAREHIRSLANESTNAIAQAVIDFEAAPDPRTMAGKKKRRAAGGKPKP